MHPFKGEFLRVWWGDRSNFLCSCFLLLQKLKTVFIHTLRKNIAVMKSSNLRISTFNIHLIHELSC